MEARMMQESSPVSLSLLVPGLPQPLLAPEQCNSWAKIRMGFEEAQALVQKEIEEGVDTLLIYSTQWPSVLGHQVQGAKRLQLTHVDQEFHELGNIEYDYAFDSLLSEAYAAAGRKRGLHMRPIAFEGFPVDTGTLVARKLLDPREQMKVAVVSCNMYADRAETIVLGKAARDALEALGRRAVVVASSGMSYRMFPQYIREEEERVSLAGDDEWNRKILEILAQGRLDDVAQLARNFFKEARADQKFKAIWWLAGVCGCHNNFEANVHAYGSIQGTGAAVVSLKLSEMLAAGQEYDEEDVEYFYGERAAVDKKIL
jgi:2-aminophenol/2-amino-5-chlorophenol 1,6-dioxygenase alpha subunit